LSELTLTYIHECDEVGNKAVQVFKDKFIFTFRCRLTLLLFVVTLDDCLI
jgi:hypothetical protein